jgi:hypothetical protein
MPPLQESEHSLSCSHQPPLDPIMSQMNPFHTFTHSFNTLINIIFPFTYRSYYRATAQAVGRRFPTAAARVRAQATSCGICCGQSGAVEGFLRVLRFPLPILFPLTAPTLSSGSGTIGQLLADVPSGLNLTPTKKLKKNFL